MRGRCIFLIRVQVAPKCSKFIRDAYGDGHQEASWYIHLMAVRPDAQKKGLGTALLRKMQEKVRRLLLLLTSTCNFVQAQNDGVDLCWQTTTAVSSSMLTFERL